MINHPQLEGLCEGFKVVNTAYFCLFPIYFVDEDYTIRGEGGGVKCGINQP